MKQPTKDTNIKGLPISFDNSNTPFGKVSLEEAEALEKILLPRIEAALEKLRQTKPHLFRPAKSERA